MAQINTPVTRLCRRPVVEKRTGLSRSTLYRRMQLGTFPKPVNIGGERVAWLESEIEAINKARIAGKTDEEIKALVKELEAARGAA